MSGPRALDHIVLPCPDLHAAAGAFAALGFTVGRRNRHPWGTENHIVQMPGAFLELIALAPDYAPLSANDEAFPFAGFLAGQGASKAPSGMIVLRSSDAAADADRMTREGISEGRMLHFSRSGQAPDGSTRTVAFSLAFASAPAMPDLGFFVCQQHHPENFWDAAMQRHPNGVTGIAEIVLTAPDPAGQAGFLSRFAAQPHTAMGEGRLTVPLAERTALVVEHGPAAALMAIRFRGGAAGTATVGPLRLAFGG